MAKATTPGTLVGYRAFVHDIYDGGSPTIGRTNVGRTRLHPGDAVESKDPGLFALSNGGVDLSKVPGVRASYRRVENEGVGELKARQKAARRRSGSAIRNARRNAAKARKAAAMAL